MIIKCNKAEAWINDTHPKVLPLAQKIVDLASVEGATVEDLMAAMDKVKSDIRENLEKKLISGV